MKRALLGLFLLCSCVPATTESEPRGAAGVALTPSPVTRGEPLVTSDGWTVRVEKFAAMATVSVSNGGATFGSGVPRIWGTSPADHYLPALPVGWYAVGLRLSGFYLGARVREHFQRSPEVAPEGTDPELVERFLRLPDNHLPAWNADEYSVEPGPTVIIVARGEKGGRTYRLDLSLVTNGVYSAYEGSGVDVHANDVAYAPFELMAERLFDTSGGRLIFQDIATADDRGDGDGHVTPIELRRLRTRGDGVPCEEDEEVEDEEDGWSSGGWSTNGCRSVLERLGRRAEAVFAARR